MSSYCATCGELLFEGEVVCPACGARQDAAAQPPAAGGAAHDPDETGVAYSPTEQRPKASVAPALTAPTKKPAKKVNRPARFEHKGVAPEHSARRNFESNAGSGPLAAIGLIVLTIAIIGLSIWVVGGGLTPERTPQGTTAPPMAADDIRRDYVVQQSYISGENVLIIIAITHNQRLSDSRCQEIIEHMGEALVRYGSSRSVTHRFRNEEHHDSWLNDGGRAELRVRLNERDRDVYYRRSFSVRR